MDNPEAEIRAYLETGEGSEAEAKELAEQEVEKGLKNYGATHSCYANDTAFLMWRFGLNKDNWAGLRVVENGMAGFFEPITHNRFKLGELLTTKFGVREFPVTTEYLSLGMPLLRELQEKLGLSTDHMVDCANRVCLWSIDSLHGEALLTADERKYGLSSGGSTLYRPSIQALSDSYLPDTPHARRITELLKQTENAPKRLSVGIKKWAEAEEMLIGHAAFMG